MILKNIILNKKYAKEQVLLFLLSIVIGVIGGLGAIVFRYLLIANHSLFFDSILSYVSYDIYGYNIGIILLPTLGGLIVGPLIYKFAREAKGHGAPEVIDAVHNNGGVIKPMVALVKIVVSSITIGSGGSAGREGPIVQIGAVFGSVVGQFFLKAKKHIRLMVCCGVAAGVSATFNAPIGGAIFAIEAISTRNGIVSAIPILISSAVGNIVLAGFLGFESPFAYSSYVFENLLELPIFIGFGIIFGLLSYVWQRTFYKIEGLFENLKFPEQFKPALGGLLVGIIGMFFSGYGIMGVGYADIDSVITGDLPLKIILVLGILKIFATSFTIGSGGSGGIFAPSLYIGAMFGAAIGLISQHIFPDIITHPYMFTLIGMGALFAGVCRVPMTALIMIPEITNNHYLLVPMIIVSTISYLIASTLSKRSMYLEKLERKGVRIKEKENILEDIMVEDVMSRKLDSINLETNISDLLPIMLEKKHLGFPVVDSDGGFNGFVKIYDLMQSKIMEKNNLKVKDVICKDYPHVFPDDNVYRALNIMIRNNLCRIPVISTKDGKKYAIGVISKSDVIKAYENGLD